MVNHIAYILALLTRLAICLGKGIFRLLCFLGRLLRENWREGLDTPFLVTYTLVFILGSAVLGLHVAHLENWIARDDLQLSTSLISVVLLIVLSLQAQALNNIRGDRELIFKRHSHLRNAYSDLHTETVDRRSKLEELSSVRELGLAINSVLDFDRLLLTSSQIISDAVDAQGHVLFLYQEEANTFSFQLGQRRNKPLKDNNRLVSHLVENYLFKSLALGVTQLLNDPHYGHLLLVPLADSEKKLGSFCLFDPGQGQFTAEHQHLVEIVGKQFSIALKNALLYDLAIKDGLTRLYVKRHFDHCLQQEIAAAHRYERALSLVMIDIDHFKRFNDTYGHQLGDTVLRRVADLIRESLRETDSAYRYGGEEMSLILSDTNAAKAKQVVERLRRRIARDEIKVDSGEIVHVTASFGVAEWDPRLKEKSQLVECADKALYQAKDSGRNKVVVWKPPKQTRQASQPSPLTPAPVPGS